MIVVEVSRTKSKAIATLQHSTLKRTVTSSFVKRCTEGLRTSSLFWNCLKRYQVANLKPTTKEAMTSAYRRAM